MKYRHEIKYFINYSDYLAMRKRLLALMQPDKHAGEDGTYEVRSLYFDNYQDKVLKEKIYGVNNREKFRIRLYNRDDSYILLEKKSKVNGLCNKISTKLNREEVEDILSGQIDFMGDTKNPLLVEFYSKIKCQLLKPKTIVDYVREAYTYKAGNVRITFDSKIKTGIYQRDLFQDLSEAQLPMIKVNNNLIILEVKYDAFLPEHIQLLLQTGNSRNTAYSKYAAARIYG